MLHNFKLRVTLNTHQRCSGTWSPRGISIALQEYRNVEYVKKMEGGWHDGGGPGIGRLGRCGTKGGSLMDSPVR